MRTPFQDKKYRISLNYRIESGLAGEFIEIDNLDELKTYLQKELVSRISLKYWNHDIKVEPKWKVENISINDISEGHFEWLVKELNNETRWLMAEDKLEKNHYPYISDGIVDNKQFVKRGILFLMKEVNSDEKKGSWDLRKFLQEGGRAYSWNNISIWTYGILEYLKNHNTVNWEEIPQNININEGFRKDMLGQIAVMNLKKSPGGTSTNNKSLKDYVKDNHTSLTKQFKILEKEVDVVICCGKPTGSLLRKHVLKPSFETWNETSNGVHYKIIDNGPLIIYYYHPASRKKQKYLYYRLMEAVKEVYEEAKLSSKE